MPQSPITVRAALLAAGALVVLSAAACRMSARPTPVAAGPVLIRIDSVGLHAVPVTRDGMRGQVWIYADGPARVGVGTAPPTALTDTLRLRTLPAFTVDVAQSDVHVRLGGEGTTAASALTIGGSVTGGPATHVGGTGRHLLLLKGGTGIRVVE